jgi:hypothetical protein
MRRIIQTVLIIEQHFRPSDLTPIVDLIDPGRDEIDLRASVTQSVRVLLPERKRTVCVSLSWGGGASATDAFWDRDLNESLRMHRCLVPFNRLADGSAAHACAQDQPLLGAGLLCWSSRPSIETCVLLGYRNDESDLAPLAVSPLFADRWLHGRAGEDLVCLLQGPPWSFPTRTIRRPVASRRRKEWEHLPLDRYRTALV